MSIRLVSSIALALSLLAAAPALEGCHALIPLIPKVVSVITDAMVTLEIIDQAADAWFATHPNVDPEVRARYTAIFTRCQTALNAANHTLRGAQKLDQKQADEAFAEFRKAYAELAELLRKERIMDNGAVKLGTGDTVKIPEPEALHFQVGQ